ncbi:sigma-70 family RNA polymerase sigma factor [Actinomadura chokoriensis]|uniref:sigma-70 family RNA polymerase sigma factor n=1 Tax=Actinomadura chokoriensis TaxID=454156 RepID=UPI0031F7E46A
MTEAQVHRALDAPRLMSLHTPAATQDGDVVPWEDRLVDPSLSPEEEVLLRSRLRAVIVQGLPTLDARERYVLTLRSGSDGEPEQSLRVIGEQLGLSREGVRQIQQKALAKLSEPIASGAAEAIRAEGRA